MDNDFDYTKLLDPGAYPEAPEAVEWSQTLISHIFFAGDHVYKVKKPVDFGFLDFTTLEKRRHYCEREVELNRRLAPDVYIGVVRVREERGAYRLEGAGRVVDYAVKMRRLPAERTLERLIERREVDESMVEEVGEVVAGFHAGTRCDEEVLRFGNLASVRVNVDENFRQVEPYVGRTIAAADFSLIRSATYGFMSRNSALFDRRVREGRVRDCHGDLRAQHIYLADKVYVIDCIEFNDRFRYIDVASEIAFLAMDLSYLGCRSLSARFVTAYVEHSGDEGVQALLGFYKSYRAFVRGKVESFRLEDPALGEGERARISGIASRYFGLSLACARGLLLRPALLVVCGLMGSGKTTLATALAEWFDLDYEGSDVARKRMAGRPLLEQRGEAYQQGLYAEEVSNRVYAHLVESAARKLRLGRPVILDATFKKASDRRRVVSLAEELGAGYLFIECRCRSEIIRSFLVKREQEGGSVSEGRLEILSDHLRDFEELYEVPAPHHIRVSTEGPVEEALEVAVGAIRARPDLHFPAGDTPCGK